ncbi:hypothetical protein AAHE18_03G151500 [Arachis hypogaea]|uniref:Uncharacterized protein n=1 Tax=Arachis hypogaea TaxID=3818 RepID=A0A445DY86_ARAHY|nr:hypothetical protein Ahy_A03g014533 isoform C [Arachis hypogaea]
MDFLHAQREAGIDGKFSGLLCVHKMFLERDVELFEQCQRQHAEKETKDKDIEEQRKLTWKRLADVATENGWTI